MKLSELKFELQQSFKQSKIDRREVDILLCEALGIRFDELYKVEEIDKKMAKKVKNFAKKKAKRHANSKNIQTRIFF